MTHQTPAGILKALRSCAAAALAWMAFAGAGANGQADERKSLAAAVEKNPVDPKTEPLAEHLVKLGLLKGENLRAFESYNPKKTYSAFEFTPDGEPIEAIMDIPQLEGARLRTSIALVVASSETDQLGPDGIKLFKVALLGSEGAVPRSAWEALIAKKLQRAQWDVKGVKLAQEQSATYRKLVEDAVQTPPTPVKGSSRVNAGKVFPIDAQKEALAAGFKRSGRWSKKELDYIEAIDPEESYKSVKFADDGSVAGETQVTGAELRKSLAILKFIASQ